MTAADGYYINYVYVDGVNLGNLTSYSFNRVQDNHTISVISASVLPINAPTIEPSPLSSPSISSSPYLNPAASPVPTQTLQPTTVLFPKAVFSFPAETAFLVAGAIIIVLLFALAFKRGFIEIDVVGEENPQEILDDFAI